MRISLPDQPPLESAFSCLTRSEKKGKRTIFYTEKLFYFSLHVFGWKKRKKYSEKRKKVYRKWKWGEFFLFLWCVVRVVYILLSLIWIPHTAPHHHLPVCSHIQLCMWIHRFFRFSIFSRENFSVFFFYYIRKAKKKFFE